MLIVTRLHWAYVDFLTYDGIHFRLCQQFLPHLAITEKLHWEREAEEKLDEFDRLYRKYLERKKYEARDHRN